MALTPLEQLKERIAGHGPVGRIADEAARLSAGMVLHATGVPGSFRAFLLAGVRERTGRMLMVVARDRAAAEEMRDDLALLTGPAAARFFGGRDPHGAQDPAREVNDVQTLRALAESPPEILVTHPGALRTPLPAPAEVARRSFTLAPGESPGYAGTLARLADLGFMQKDFVETYGDYAVRGGILDIYPFIGENPVRVEFWGDAIESIREFDPTSQRSIKELSTAVIVPDVISTSSGAGASGAASGLLTYLPAEALLVLDEPDIIMAALQDQAPQEGMAPAALLDAVLAGFPQLRLSALGARGALDCGAVPQPAFNASIALLHRDLAALQERGALIVLTCDSPSVLARLKDLLASIGTTPEGEAAEALPPLDIGRVIFSVDAFHQGFLIPGMPLALYTEHQIFNRVKRRGKRRAARFKGFTEKELRELRRGDYVVHEDFGIGRFDGLKRITVQGAEQEVVAVRYEEKDVLYVNLNYIGKLQKYSSREGHVPKLTRLGSQEWDRLRARVKRRVKDIARDLIRLYARRKQLAGFGFSRDTPWQKELEASFMYEDTFDQAKATLEVKQDMEDQSPMDRLICGDVGFGKTEVAVRASFKAVLDGKQVAVLVPTTILAMQHFNTFVDRTARYGVRVAVLSRFKQRKEQLQILAHLAAGAIDIIIGTHRLLSKDVIFKDLGLLIIDEEHRFGVAAKEKLRQLRANVDTLSLTATPIPRTLHFSLMGARDLSIIATPPRNRLPVITEIATWSADLIREAVVREVHRGGQVYFVHDRVENIEEVANRLREIVPAVRLRVAHGQMHAHDLEEVMMDFLERRCDMLVATKIIESGLDIPNVNTIVINRADRFGMAELYQLRGRVGRSNVQAYAYLLTPPPSSLPRQTLQRLQAVEEFTELGSGFNLAMRDLEIRGAGNLLGSEQSGFIESMGFETYTRILEQAVQELKEEEFKDLFKEQGRAVRPGRNTLVEADVDAFVPESYIRQDTERLAVYRRLYGLETESQLREVADELRDRFGPFPPMVENLFRMVRLRLLAARIGFVRVGVTGATLEADLPPEEDAQFYGSDAFQHLMSAIASMKSSGLILRQTGKALTLTAPLRVDERDGRPLDAAITLLARLVPPPAEMKKT